MKRFQVDIKPNHQPSVRQLMKRLGDVSSADAIGFLIETQISAALARLEPALKMPQFATESTPCVTEAFHPVASSTNQQRGQQRDVARSHKPSAASHTTPQDDATSALDTLLGG